MILDIYSDGTNSSIKEVIDSWYESNMINYTEKLEDTVWCNDRSISSTDENSFGAYERLVNNSPSLNCSSDYQLSVAATDIDKHLKYPIALLTADEVTFAGSGTSAYLYTGDYWWTLSPYGYFWADYDYGVFFVNSSGYLSSYDGFPKYGVRPSISLKNSIVVKKGNGSLNNPYIVG